MSGESKPGTMRAERVVRVGVSDVEVSSQGLGTAARGRGGVLAATLEHTGRSGLIEALSNRLISEARAAPGPTALTRREAVELARRIVDRLITEEQDKHA